LSSIAKCPDIPRRRSAEGDAPQLTLSFNGGKDSAVMMMLLKEACVIRICISTVMMMLLKEKSQCDTPYYATN
jgi:predicted phosphoadenosine phosphosulfate sulfurtransferase